MGLQRRKGRGEETLGDESIVTLFSIKGFIITSEQISGCFTCTSLDVKCDYRHLFFQKSCRGKLLLGKSPSLQNDVSLPTWVFPLLVQEASMC